MSVPWLQIVQLVPSILDVSRELMRRSRRMPLAGEGAELPAPADFAGRFAALEENERRQAELVAQMAEQNAKLTQALMLLHRQMRWTWAALAVAIALAIVALIR